MVLLALAGDDLVLLFWEGVDFGVVVDGDGEDLDRIGGVLDTEGKSGVEDVAVCAVVGVVFWFGGSNDSDRMGLSVSPEMDDGQNVIWLLGK